MTFGHRNQKEATMEELTERVGRGLVDAIVAVGLAGFLILMWHWFHGGYKHLAGILKERNVSRRTLQTRKRKEAQVLSDGTTILLKELKEQGLLTDIGLAYWSKKFETIGLVKPEEDNLLGKAWHYPVTHSMRELKKYLTKPRFTPKSKEDKTTRVYLD
jgi:hypothetical protein